VGSWWRGLMGQLLAASSISGLVIKFFVEIVTTVFPYAGSIKK